MTLTAERLLTPDELAEYLGRRRKWVVDHAAQLDGEKVGRFWRFDLDKVRASLRHSGARMADDQVDDVDPLTPTPLSAARMASKTA